MVKLLKSTRVISPTRFKNTIDWETIPNSNRSTMTREEARINSQLKQDMLDPVAKSFVNHR